MKRNSLAVSLSLALFFATFASLTFAAEEPVTLIGTIVKWRYPDAKMTKSQMSDAATIDVDGKRTAPSSMLRTTLVTEDSVEKVLTFYKDLLKREAATGEKLGVRPETGLSVVFTDESEDRPFEFHTVLVNSKKSSTTLIITRGKNEEKTHIVWKQYVKHEIGANR